MIELILPEQLLKPGQLEILPGLPDIHSITLQLIVWNDPGSGTKYIYSPGPQARFFTRQATQSLIIDLFCENKPGGGPRYTILGHSTKKKKKNTGTSEIFQMVHYKKRNGAYHEVTGKHSFPANSDPAVEIDSMKYTLQLDQHKDDTYITIIVKDLVDGSIIDCDPQVENGTKT